MNLRLKVRTFALSLAAFAVFTITNTNAKGEDVQKTAENYITDFRNGVDLKGNDRVGGIVINGRIASSQLSLLAKELAGGSPRVRRNIVELLGRIGRALDTPNSQKMPVIRDTAVIRTLVVEGFANDDSAASAAARILTENCLPADLAAFSDVYAKSLETGSGNYLFVAAKAKTLQAAQYVEKMARSPLWQEYEEDLHLIKIAQAALGNVSVENDFIRDVYDAAQNAPPAQKNRFYDVVDEKDGAEVASRMAFLGYIGTRRTLQVACGFLRSPLRTYVGNVLERSVRYDALDAILYNFPDERVLYKPVHWVEWVAAEQFCIEKIGATFDGPTPNLPYDRIYPHH